MSAGGDQPLEAEDDPASVSPPDAHLEVPADHDVVDGELVNEVRALRDEVRATIDHNFSASLGLNPSQIEAVDAASADFRTVLIDCYQEVVRAEVASTDQMTALTAKDQQDSVDVVKRGLWILVAIVGLLVAVAVIAVIAGETAVAVAALSPIGVAAIGGVVTIALRGRNGDSA